MLGVVAAAPGALFGLVPRGLERLAHLGHHDRPNSSRLGLQDLGGAEHHAGPLGEGGAAVARKVSAAAWSRLQLGGGVRLEGAKGLAGGGVNGGERHGSRSHTEGPTALARNDTSALISSSMSPLRLLLDHSIDYAGLFPPAALAMRPALENYARYRSGPDAWALGRFVVPAGRLDEFEAASPACCPRASEEPWRLQRADRARSGGRPPPSGATSTAGTRARAPARWWPTWSSSRRRPPTPSRTRWPGCLATWPPIVELPLERDPGPRWRPSPAHGAGPRCGPAG